MEYVVKPVETSGEDSEFNTKVIIKDNSKRRADREHGVIKGKPDPVSRVKKNGPDVTYDSIYETVRDEVRYGKVPEGSPKRHPGQLNRHCPVKLKLVQTSINCTGRDPTTIFHTSQLKHA